MSNYLKKSNCTYLLIKMKKIYIMGERKKRIMLVRKKLEIENIMNN